MRLEGGIFLWEKNQNQSEICKKVEMLCSLVIAKRESPFQKLDQTNRARTAVGVSDVKDKKNQITQSKNEGREKYFIDVDRMINEGLGGGTVSMRENSGRIEEARDFQLEDPPHEVDDE